MELEGNLVIERTRTRRWVSIVAVTVPVFIVVGVAAWFIRAFVAPPMVTIPPPMTLAAAPPPSAEPASEPQQQSARVEVAHAGPAMQESPQPLPMFGSFALVPPSVSLRTAPRPNVESEPSAAAEPATPANRDSVATAQPVAVAGASPEISEPAAASSEPAEPATSAVPLPPHRPRTTVALASGRVPLPRPRPASGAASTFSEGEQRMFHAHGVE